MDTIKVTVDAAIFKDRGEFGYGLIARDHKGHVIEARTRLQQGVVWPEVAESMTIKEALSWIKEMNWSQVELETDCLGCGSGDKESNSDAFFVWDISGGVSHAS